MAERRGCRRSIDIASLDEGAKRSALQDFLADEFQIVRSNGVRHDKAGYIENPSSTVHVEIVDLDATRAGETLVVSYELVATLIIDGLESVTRAPRLATFQLGEDGRWRLVSHANFAALPEEDAEPPAGAACHHARLPAKWCPGRRTAGNSRLEPRHLWFGHLGIG